jgi:L,D-peptidoglycan transpeptidase YkuD (ErfK/YbiS/YcfS/YnhG family)
MRTVLRWIIISLAGAGLVTLILFLLVRLTPSPPVDDVDYAMLTLSRAATNKAGTYSRKLYSEAKSNFDSAMQEWKKENKKFLYSRDYEKVQKYALAAISKAKQANESSISNSNSLQAKVKEKLDSVNKTASLIDNLFGRYPFTAEIRNRISNGRMLLNESEIAYSKGQYLPANRKISDAEYLLNSVYETATSEIKTYFRSFSTWKQWTQAAISESRRNNSYCIIVDKLSKKCYVYLGGVKKYDFDAELGRNWIGEKRKMGDKATPEGNYKVDRKYQGKETQYHKALNINYPNDEDRERFRRDISAGTLPSSSRIGNGIQIHGGGGKGVDWTEGCIALKDSDVDMIFKLAKVGTPVTIVGSMKSFEEIIVE